MENIYWILVAVLMLLAISDLIVGVSNDAVNFLNSAIGAKVASFKTIMIIAALGIIVGATFSSGMMEVARKGIFNPQYFVFSEIILIFLAVMLTDVILLDVFNTYGMPTSTTVSIVFELLGAAVGISLIKIMGSSNALGLSEYINTSNALMIIAGIFLSVIFAFTIGALIQYLSRLLFSFNFKKRLKYFGAVWGGIAISSITYFILIKGAKGASFMSDDIVDYFKENTFLILMASFIGWTIILEILKRLVKLNILKLIVFVGTFALAMAFAGNDLVNFIGVPLAGLESYKTLIATPGADPESFLMTSLSEKVKTPTIFLLFAGLIMVVTLWTSKKARSVVQTSLDLGRQDEGSERFNSSALSRLIVRGAGNLAQGIHKMIPPSLQMKIDKQFDQSYFISQQRHLGKEAPAFDLVRASVTLVVASILIAFGTSMKLPLSTTYVTFMVAMGTSLADRAWGRESAVYRITGVLSVIGGWFFTAFSAFTLAFIMSFILYYGGIYVTIILLVIIAYVIYRTHFVHKKRSDAAKANIEELELTNTKIFQRVSDDVENELKGFTTILDNALESLQFDSFTTIKKTYKNFKKLDQKSKLLKDNISKTINKLVESDIDSGHFYVQVIDALREISHAIRHIIEPIYQHIDNSHKPLLKNQLEELKDLQNKSNQLVLKIVEVIDNLDYSQQEIIEKQQEEVLNNILILRKQQVKRIKSNVTGTKNSMLYFNILEEQKRIALRVLTLYKAQRDFTLYINEK